METEKKQSCTVCQKLVLNLGLHLKRSVNCQTEYSIADIKQNKQDASRAENKDKQNAFRLRKKAVDAETYRVQNNAAVKRCRETKKAKDIHLFRAQHNTAMKRF